MARLNRPKATTDDGKEHRTGPPTPRKRHVDEAWTKETFHDDLRRATGKIEEAIRRDPNEVELLKKRLKRVRAKEKEGNWGVKDSETPNADTE